MDAIEGTQADRMLECRMMLHAPDGAMRCPLLFSSRPPSGDRFPEGSIQFGVAALPDGSWTVEEIQQKYADHERLLELFPGAAKVLKEHDRRLGQGVESLGGTSLGVLADELEQATGLMGYRVGTTERWVPAARIPPGNGPAPIAVDF
jgi:hypothetical protein